MQIIRGSKKNHYLNRINSFLIVAALITGMISCDSVGGEVYALTIASTTGGSVTTPGEGTFTYDEGAVIDIAAEAEAGYRFVQWTGNVSAIADVNAASTNITMKNNYEIMAEFVRQYNLSINSTDGGNVTIPGEDTFTYDCGTVVDLVAAAEEGYSFVNWIGDVDTIVDVNAASTNITMNSNYSVTAEFIKQYSLDINSSTPGPPGGSVTMPGEGTFIYDEGTVVGLVAVANEGYRFVVWTGDVDTIVNIDAATTTVTMNGDYHITANFASATAVYDWYDLDGIRGDLDEYYILMNDLGSTTPGYAELASPTANEGKGWRPIGSWDALFTGTFDGQGYEVLNLFINRSDENEVGLFGAVGEGGHIEDIGVVSADVTGCDYVGGLVGTNLGTVSNSYSTGSVTGGHYVGGHDVGGLVGLNDGTVSDSYATGSVTGGEWVGGLMGWNSGTVSNSYATGSVTGDDHIIGGLVGTNFGTVSNSYSTGSVTGGRNVGGLVAENYKGTVSDSYATGSVSGETRVGALVGYNYEGVVSNSYSTGNVTGDEHVGGLVGENVDGTVSNSFWDIETSGQVTSDGGTGKTTAQMKDIVTFSGAGWNIIAVLNPSTRNPTYIWNIVDDVTYPFLSWQS